MVHRYRLNRLCQFGSFLNIHLNCSRSDSQLLATLKHMDEVLYTGVPISRSEEDYAYNAGIPLVVSYASPNEQRLAFNEIIRTCLEALNVTA